LESNDVARLDFFIPAFHNFQNVINRHFEVFHNTTHLQLVHAEGHGEYLGVLVPDEAILFDLVDFFGKSL